MTINQPALIPPPTNNRGLPWSSAGRRNLACAGTGLGNGGVRPPQYERRRDALDERVMTRKRPKDARWMIDWRKLVGHLQHDGLLTPNDAAVANAIAQNSNDYGQAVDPAQATIGRYVQRCARTVRTSLARLRELGLIEWNHRFEGYPGHHVAQLKATSNIYDFRMPVELLERYDLRNFRRRREHGEALARVANSSAAEKLAAAREAKLSDAETFGRLNGQLAASGDGHPEHTFDILRQTTEDQYAGDPERVLRALEAFDEAYKRMAERTALVSGRSPPDSS